MQCVIKSMRTLEEYIELYKTNIQYLQDNTDDVLDEILNTIKDYNFFCTPSRFEEDKWVLDVISNEEPSESLPIVRRGTNFTDYHIDEKYVNCLRIKICPFSDLTREDLDGKLKRN